MVSKIVGLGFLDWARQPILARIRQVIRQVIPQSLVGAPSETWFNTCNAF